MSRHIEEFKQEEDEKVSGTISFDMAVRHGAC